MNSNDRRILELAGVLNEAGFVQDKVVAPVAGVLKTGVKILGGMMNRGVGSQSSIRGVANSKQAYEQISSLLQMLSTFKEPKEVIVKKVSFLLKEFMSTSAPKAQPAPVEAPAPEAIPK